MEIKEKKIEEKQVAYISFKGSYDEVPVLLGEIVGFIGAPMEIYLSDPNEVPENELLTEV